ncbi:protein-export chaperone SecB [Chthonobacter albigriseus]|uniref:protein-export chaperone SecB n=1 Tax=Chthonobacter albigriseus TaxID=1683161 RepID=UPI0015EF1A8C|nr:protein-export chaperone SecB [Chthonobacter albigriseus]
MTTVGPDTQGGIPQQPSLNVIAQYTKDLSFENPKAPDSLRPRDKSPAISVGVNVGSKQRSGIEYEVDLKIEVKAELDDEVVFQIELLYGGLFRVQNVPQQHLHPFVMIECPRLLFPFARQIIADASVRGGFPPLLIDPIDFVGLYQQYISRMQQQVQ